ncbi:XkdQ/YqbQ family protein [Brevibacillus dissolubilis]|uniref:XkdQ/YqbQ family protein n=1 Tax=Brevibacillus dissolubilis TaxID=1844116 RepID=UPI001115BE59|nr:hypothetical protein [Brevibacillus dissolubilis]
MNQTQPLSVYLVTKDKTFDITDLIESVDWSGGRTKAPRTLAVQLVNTERGSHQKITAENGNGLILRLGDQELFRGIIFTCDYSKDKLAITAYDQMIYLTKNTDSLLFTGKKASEIIQKLCSDFSIPAGTIDDTKFVIPYLIFDGDTLYDMALKALEITYRQTGKRYAFYSRDGKVHLIPREKNTIQWVIEDGVNLVDYSYQTSIEETVTKVKLQAGEESKTITATAEDAELQKKFGVLQHYEKVKEKVIRATLQERAKQILAKEGREKRTFSINNIFGIPDVISGTAVYVMVKELDIQKAYYVEEDSHSFTGRKHMMSLTLSETDEVQVKAKESKG